MQNGFWKNTEEAIMKEVKIGFSAIADNQVKKQVAITINSIIAPRLSQMLWRMVRRTGLSRSTRFLRGAYLSFQWVTAGNLFHPRHSKDCFSLLPVKMFAPANMVCTRAQRRVDGNIDRERNKFYISDVYILVICFTLHHLYFNSISNFKSYRTLRGSTRFQRNK